MMNSARGDSSTGSELKAVEEACREASRTVEPCELCGKSRRKVVTQFKTRSFTEFILSKAEGFSMTTPIKCHSERSEESLCRDLLKTCAGPPK
jgi:hypothetical protein